VSVCGKKCHLSFRIASISIICVGFYELVYSESIGGFVWGNADVLAHKLVLAVGFRSGSLKDGLWLKERLDPVDAKFTTYAGVFESAERCLLVV